MNWLFLVFLIVAAIGAVVTRQRTRTQAGRTAQGPVPGYTVTHGEELALQPESALKRGVDWWPELVEEFHSAGRARIVLRFRVRPQVAAADLKELLEQAARSVSQQTHAHVALVEAHTAGVLRGIYLWAPDGGGWTGGDGVGEIWYQRG